MALRTKLVISFTVLLLVVIAAVGLVASNSIRSILVAQTDRTLQSFADRGPRPQPRPDGPYDEPFLRPFAEMLVAADGTVVYAQQAGFADAPNPLPDVSDLGTAQGLVYLDSVDGGIEYRAAVQRLPDGTAIIHAAPLTDVATATSSLVRALLLAGGGVLLLGGAATWWTVRGAMGPVDEMVDTAEAIAGGDLSQRVPESDPATELGRLGIALNEMLAHLESSIETEREAKERLRQFVADASHELRTPLTAIAGYAELHERGGLDDADAEAAAWRRIVAESKRMGGLVDDLVMLARLGQTQPLHLSEIDLVAIARDAAADHAAADPSRPVTINAPESVPIRADGERIHQVLASLLSNTSVHTPVGTKVSVEIVDRGDVVEIDVLDDGPGIPSHAVGQIFERFYRADPSRSRRSGGSGLGLAIVAAIVEAHGGTVDADNVYGGGARISLTLPRR